ncbi:sodium- and chloride-dependent glycine transporter 1-like [Babylonia areolata]|uniref:sodium- and chloride-dependent glycine transporter 1-like n=1 Tax=Babylonia areolata TaxID=304850 RepID=UPI003FCF8304
MAGEQIERGNWGRQLDFLLSCVGFAVGLGNVWRFPYLAYRNGGASFLFPYILMLFIAGLPLFFMELALGQFASEGPITVWKMSPFFAGIGYAMCTISGVVSIYYNVIITYAIYYMFVAFVNLDSDLPWAHCDPDWATPQCRDRPYPSLATMNETAAMQAIKTDVYKDSCIRDKMNDVSFVSNLTAAFPSGGGGVATSLAYSSLNSTHILHKLFDGCKKHWVSPASDFLSQYVLRLHEADDMGNLGGISLKIILTLALAWILIFFCLMKGVKSSGKVVYFTATFPYVILIVLLARGVTLDGHMDGIRFYVIPDWDKLADAKVWGDAATQIFYSLGVGFGGLLTMASYNKFKNNCYRDAIMVALINCGTSIFAGFAIFSLLGHMAHVTNQDVADVADSGPGLAFVAYPDGITNLPAQSLWAFLFFFMILTLGLDSQFAMMETVISGISDMFPHVLRKRKVLFTFITCLVGFLLGIPQTTKGGMWVLTLMDWYSGSYNLMFVALAEIICLMYVYGYKNFFADIEMMIGHKPNIYWMVTWLAITPIAVAFIIIIGAVQYTKASYAGYVFEDWVQGLGWLMVSVPIALIAIVGVVQMFRYGVPDCFHPLASWGPADPENRIGRYAPATLPFTMQEGKDGPVSVVGVTRNTPINGYDNAAYAKESERL